MVDLIYATKLQLNKTNSSDTEAPLLDLNLCIANGTVSTKIYDKRDDSDFDIVNFTFLDGDVPQRTSYGVYISQLIRFTRASSNLSDFKCRNKALTAKLLRQGYRYFKLCKAFLKSYRRHSALVEKLEIVFVKHYAPNHMLASKDNTRLNWLNLQRAITPEIFFRIYSKGNQVIFSSFSIYSSSYEALVPTVFEIFC